MGFLESPRGRNVVKNSGIRVFLQRHQILRCRKTMDYENHTTFMAISSCFKSRKVCNVVKFNVLLLSLQRHLAVVKVLAFHTDYAQNVSRDFQSFG